MQEPTERGDRRWLQLPEEWSGWLPPGHAPRRSPVEGASNERSPVSFGVSLVEAFDRRVAVVRAAAGDRFADVELNLLVAAWARARRRSTSRSSAGRPVSITLRSQGCPTVASCDGRPFAGVSREVRRELRERPGAVPDDVRQSHQTSALTLALPALVSSPPAQPVAGADAGHRVTERVTRSRGPGWGIGVPRGWPAAARPGRR